MMNKLKFYISNVLIVSKIAIVLLMLSSSTAFAKSYNVSDSSNKYNVLVKSITFPSTEDGKISDPITFKELDYASLDNNSLNDYSVKVDIFPEVCFQKINGVGGCFNEIGCLEFQALSKDKRSQVMHNLFSRDGAGFSFCRTAIGSSDFGKDAYSYDDFAKDYKMEHFSVKRDLKSIIPSIQEAYDVNPDLKMFASPWSPPFWMKVSQRMEGNDTQTEDSIKKNTMIDLPQIKQAYALYMSKYIQAYSKYGINIDRLCPQNETDANPKYPSNIMSTSFMSDLITDYFCPQFVKDNIKTEIWAGTFRVAKYKKGHFEAIKIVNDDYLFNYIGGLGVQYTSPRYLNDLRQARPNLRMMHTEGICYNGENTIAQAKSRLEEVAGYINAGVENYAYWNIFLDKPQQSGWGWKQNSLITIDAINDSVVYNPDYKVVSLISGALRPGDVRCANFLSSSDPIISVLAPNGDVKVLIQNDSNKSKKVRLSVSENEFHYVVLPANSLNSITLEKGEIWKDSNKPVDERVEDLVSRLTLEEKISQCSSNIPAIDRLGIPAYEWYGEALHGIIAWGCTQFPQNIAMGCSWNPDLMFNVATAISNEVRALKNAGEKEVMMFSPTVNMARDPRWGRNEECYSEDPFLMSEMARMYVRGMQGNDKKYLKTVTTVKHYVANNVDNGREKISSYINKKDLYEYYFPAFKTCVVDEKAAGIMTALNGLNGVPCSGNDWLINGVLRNEWGFEGYVIADWAAASGIQKTHKYVKTQEQAAAMAIKAGVDQECFRPKTSPMGKHIMSAIKKGLLSEKQLDVAVSHLLRLRFMTGDFDKPSINPYYKIPKSVLECDAHKKLALEAAQQTIVLLKNDNILPLKKDIKSLAVIGPFADKCWMGIYSGFPRNRVSPLEGIKNNTTAKVKYAEGCGIMLDSTDNKKIAEAVALAKESEYVVLIVGNDESTSTENVDRISLKLPGNQHQLIRAVQAVNKNVILVLVPSGATAISWEKKNIPGIICAWPNGQEQGDALANVLFGDVNPGGKLCSTWFNSVNDLPDMNNYNIQDNRTYMYFKGSVLYPFGYGLSYTTFKLDDVNISTKKLKFSEDLVVSTNVTNTGDMDGDEIIQVYIKDVKSKLRVPLKALKGFKRISVPKGQTAKVNIRLPYEAFQHYDTISNKFEVEGGKFEIMVGTSSDNIVMTKTIKVKGGNIPSIKVGQKSGFYNAEDKSLTEKWDFIYKNYNSFKSEKSNKTEDGVWVDFEILFTDPGFYVNTWDAEIIFNSFSKNTVVETSMYGTKINTYKVPDNKILPIKIPIPPEYGKPVLLRVKILKGDANIKEIRVLPPGGEKSFIVKKKN